LIHRKNEVARRNAGFFKSIPPKLAHKRKTRIYAYLVIVSAFFDPSGITRVVIDSGLERTSRDRGGNTRGSDGQGLASYFTEDKETKCHHFESTQTQQP
jgi:hypothetical protein